MLSPYVQAAYVERSEHHSTSYTPILGKHRGSCTVCNATFYEPHTWVYEILSGKYRCSVCNAVSNSPAVGLSEPGGSVQMATKPQEDFVYPDICDQSKNMYDE